MADWWSSASSEYGGGWEAIFLLDENAQQRLGERQGRRTGRIEIVISMPERSEIHAVAFDTAAVEKPERSAKNVDVLISDISATARLQAARRA